MTRPALKYHGLRFARSLDEAFRTPRYATAIEGPYMPAWKRLLSFFWRLA